MSAGHELGTVSFVPASIVGGGIEHSDVTR
jgi:hypothetical protein